MSSSEENTVNQMEPEDKDEIILQNEVEVNETPGIQMGGFFNLNSNYFTNYFIKYGQSYIYDIVARGFVVENKRNTRVNIELNFDKIKEDVTIYIPPISYYFDISGVNVEVPNSYDTYIASLPKSQVYKSWARKWNAKISHTPNLLDKMNYLFLRTIQQEVTNQNIENAKAYISILSRIYVIFLLIFTTSTNFTASHPLATTQNVDNYDNLFDILLIFENAGIFGENSVILKDSNTYPAHKSVINKKVSPPLQGKLTVDNLYECVFIKEKDNFINLINNDNTRTKTKNFAYYFLEYMYQYVSILLYTIFNINSGQTNDEIKMYKEFRTTKEFLDKMPEIIEQGFAQKAVSSATTAAKTTTGLTPFKAVQNFLRNFFDLLERNTDVVKLAQEIDARAPPTTGPPTGPPTAKSDSIKTFIKIVDELDANTNAILGNTNQTDKEAIENIGFSESFLNKLKSRIKTAKFEEIESLITTQGYALEIKELATDIKNSIDTQNFLEVELKNLKNALNTEQTTRNTAKAELDSATAEVARITDEIKKATPPVDPAKLAAQQVATKNKDEKQKIFNDADTKFKAAETLVVDTQKKLTIEITNLTTKRVAIFNLIKSISRERYDEPALKKLTTDNILKIMFDFNLDSVKKQLAPSIAAINTARDVILKKDIKKPTPTFTITTLPSIVPPYPDVILPLTNEFKTFQDEFIKLRDNLKLAYTNYKNNFSTIFLVRASDEMQKQIDDIIASISRTAPLDLVISKSEYEETIQDSKTGRAFAPATKLININNLLKMKIDTIANQFIELKELITNKIENKTAAPISGAATNYIQELKPTEVIPQGPYYEPPSALDGLLELELIKKLQATLESQQGGMEQGGKEQGGKEQGTIKQQNQTRRNRKSHNATRKNSRRNNETSY